jgi:hypothetical protein
VHLWQQQKQKNDKIIISPLPNQIEPLVVVDIIARAGCLVMQTQNARTYAGIAGGVAGFVMMADLLSIQTISVMVFNAMVLLQLRRELLERV